MQEYDWKEDYNCIVLRWCVGYLNDEELSAFLNKAKSHLLNPTGRISRNTCLSSFIFVLDNVRGKKSDLKELRGERVRCKEELEALFQKAGISIKA